MRLRIFDNLLFSFGVLYLFFGLFTITILANEIIVSKTGTITTIHKAIELAEDFDVIIIKPGHYAEGNIIINKMVKIIGEDYPVIDGEGDGEVFTVTVDSVTISGPEVIIDTIKVVSTEPVIMSDVNRSFDMELKMQPQNKVEFDPLEVWIQVPIEKFTEASLKVQIEVVNMPDSLLLRPFPPAVTVNCQIGLSAYETLNEHLFRAVIDYAEVGNMLGNKLQVQIIKMPVYIQSVNFTPKSVEYIVER